MADTTAEYTLLPDGSVGVNNRCRTKDGDIDSASGTASAAKDSGNAKLEVSFFKPFKGDYWIIGLDPRISLVRRGRAKPQGLVDIVAQPATRA